MTPRSLSTLLSVALISASCAVAQQPAPATPPPDASPAPAAAPRALRGPKIARDVRTITINAEGMRPGSRIAPPGIWWKNPEIIQKLTLSDDQQKKMDGIFQQSRIQLIDLKANVEKQEVILEPMLDANPPDTNKVLAQIDHIAQARAELEKANARMLLSIRSVLTSDQWTKLQADRGNRHMMMFKGKGMPEGPGGPEGMMGMHREFHFTTPDGPLEPTPAPLPPLQ
jgi:Spy/CpxP family protein refolding chaperone